MLQGRRCPSCGSGDTEKLCTQFESATQAITYRYSCLACDRKWQSPLPPPDVPQFSDPVTQYVETGDVDE